jgi:lipoprotein-releasing system permease protein
VHTDYRALAAELRRRRRARTLVVVLTALPELETQALVEAARSLLPQHLPLVVVLEVSTGMIEGITGRLLEVGSAHLRASLPADASVADMAAAAEAVRALPGVAAAVPERQGTVLLAVGTRSAGVTLRCVDPVAFAGDEGLQRYLSTAAGSLDLAKPRTILLSAALARTLVVGVGDELLSVAGLPSAGAALPRVTRFTVVGVYETGYQELDKAVAYAGLDAAASALPRGARTLLGIKVADPFGSLVAVADRVADALGNETSVASWRDLERTRLAAFETTRWLLVLIMGLVAMVAAANVSSTVLMLVLERRQEIAILLGIGARPSVLTRSFLFAGLVAAVAGITLGTAIGLVVAVNINGVIACLDAIAGFAGAAWQILRAPFVPSAVPPEAHALFQSAYYLSDIPVRIRAFEVAAAAVGTLLVACFAAYVPAKRAGRLPPLEVLRRS